MKNPDYRPKYRDFSLPKKMGAMKLVFLAALATVAASHVISEREHR